MNPENKTSYRVVCLDTDETAAMFVGDGVQRRLAISMAYRLAKQAEAGERFAVIEETIIHVAPAPQLQEGPANHHYEN
jgi:hypothetical protein